MSNHDDLKRATENLLEVATILRRALAIQPSPAVSDVLASAQRALNEEAKKAQSPAGITFDDSETATVLASLRLFQREYEDEPSEVIAADWPEHFTCNHGTLGDVDDMPNVTPEPLGSEDIDTLCERINCALDIPALAEKCAATTTQQDSHIISLLTPVLRATDK